MAVPKAMRDLVAKKARLQIEKQQRGAEAEKRRVKEDEKRKRRAEKRAEKKAEKKDKKKLKDDDDYLVKLKQLAEEVETLELEADEDVKSPSVTTPPEEEKEELRDLQPLPEELPGTPPHPEAGKSQQAGSQKSTPRGGSKSGRSAEYSCVGTVNSQDESRQAARCDQAPQENAKPKRLSKVTTKQIREAPKEGRFNLFIKITDQSDSEEDDSEPTERASRSSPDKECPRFRVRWQNSNAV
jgi:hypothetical protein